MAELITYLLAAMGLTILIVWPQTGPGAWARERLLRPMLPGSVGEVVDCYLCCGFWCGLVLSPLWAWGFGQSWAWAGCLMVPALFWLILSGPPSTEPAAESTGEAP